VRILYIGDSSPSSTSRHRADALDRLGHTVAIEDPYAAFSERMRGRLRGLMHYHLGYQLLEKSICSWIHRLQLRYLDRPDLVWVNGGELIGLQAATMLRGFGCPLVLYSNDDPTGSRDGRRFASLLKALPVYDLCAVVRLQSIPEFLARNAKRVHRVWMSYDEVAHRPFDDPVQIPPSFRSDVVFVGTWMRGEERDRFILSLIARDLNVAIWGDRWQKAPAWSLLRPHWRGPALSGRNYVAAIQGAKVALGLLSRGNRDLHTTRSAEIPYAGGLLCAQRTSEHLEMYREGEEAFFWRDADECATVCHRLLADEHTRERTRAQGAARVRRGRFGNEGVCREILSQVFMPEPLPDSWVRPKRDAP
jgi:spore maturation protein CgeB